jgi:hypothetical protein
MVPLPTATAASAAEESGGVGVTPQAPADPYPGWASYANTEYGFSLRYPPTWMVAEVNEENFGKPGSRWVELSQGTAKLIIGYRRSGEDAVIWGSGVAAGEFELRGTARILDQDVERQVLVYEGRDKVVFYSIPPGVIAAGGLEFAASLNPFAQADYAQVALDQGVQDEADAILSTLTVGATATAMPTSAVPDEEILWDSEITSLDETWNLYTSNGQGFAIKFPNTMVTFRGSCVWNEEQGSYRPQLAFVPVKIFEDSDAVYIAPAHYFGLAGERIEGHRHYYDECNQITNSLELLRDPENWNEPSWKLMIKEIHNDAELDAFLKARYGSGCSVGEKVPAAQDGVYDVKILEDGKAMGETQCLLNFETVVKYYPAGNKVIAWDTGQAPTFPADVNYSVTHDQEMIDSFNFLTDVAGVTAVEPKDTD